MVTRIGHVGLRVRDLERSVVHAQKFLGLREVERTATASYLTCNRRHHELVLIASPESACDHLAFEVPNLAALEEAEAILRTDGVRILSDEPQEPGIEGALRFLGPGGFVFELFHGMQPDQPVAYDTVGIRPRKFEHITVKSTRKDEMEAFLQRLGFRLSDRSGDSISWFRCSPEHHGFSVIAADSDQLQHYAWQIDGWDEIRRIGDHLAQNGKTFLWGPGHHGIGDNYFCYFYDDDGAVVEYSAGMLRVEDEASYVPRTWPDEPLSVNRWGNPPPPSEFFGAGIPAAASRAAVAR